MNQKSLNRRYPAGPVGALALAIVLTCSSVYVLAGPREQAKRMHDRLTGVSPTPTVLDAIESELNTNGAESAAQMVMDPLQNPQAKNFYNVTLKNFAMPWTNEEQSVFAPLNDYVATVIGMVRDDVPFDQVLYGDILYVGQGSGVPAYSNSDNNQYEYLENNGLDLSDANVLAQRSQSQVTGLPANATAGVMTTRAASRAFFIDGTNRAMFRFTLLNHLCNDMEQMKDNSRPTDRIRQDVSRSPGGDSRVFLNNCASCHAGMDPMAQAFASYDFTYPTDNEDAGQLVYTPGVVQPKYHINEDNFKYGYITPDDHWDNYWRTGVRSDLGWNASLPGSGDGAKSLGQELAGSDAFATCQVKKVFKAVCLRDPNSTADVNQANSMVTTFKSGYNLKTVFAQTAAYCKGN